MNNTQSGYIEDTLQYIRRFRDTILDFSRDGVEEGGLPPAMNLFWLDEGTMPYVTAVSLVLEKNGTKSTVRQYSLDWPMQSQGRRVMFFETHKTEKDILEIGLGAKDVWEKCNLRGIAYSWLLPDREIVVCPSLSDVEQYINQLTKATIPKETQ